MSYAVGFIPARGGSKRVPRKNIRLLNRKPLLQYSIEHARASNLLDEIVVSTDDMEIADFARKFSCTVIIRPPELAVDKTPMVDTIKHCIEQLTEKGREIDYIVLLQPTVPIRDIEKIDKAILMLKEYDCDSVISHIQVDYFHPNRMKKIIDGRIVPYYEEEIENISRDELAKAFYRDGSIYAMKASLPMEKNSVFGEYVMPIINSPDTFVNIDNEKDWMLAEILMNRQKEVLENIG